MTLCINCKHHRQDNICQHWCEHPANGVDPVRGGVKSTQCFFARSPLSGVCGPAGDLFEEAPAVPPVEPDAYWVEPTLWQRVKALVRRVWPW